MAVPKTAVRKQDGSVFWKDQIGLTGKSSHMKSETEAATVQTPPQEHLRVGILATYAGHHSAAYSRRNDVSHWPAFALGEPPDSSSPRRQRREHAVP